MKYWNFPKTGAVDNLTLAEADIPRPGRGQVLVRVHATSLNYRDLLVAKNMYPLGALLPNLVPLSDGAGEVVEVGADVTRVAVGDRVAGIFMQTWSGGEMEATDSRSALGGEHHGMLSEYVVLDQNGVVKIPDHLSFHEAATLPCAAVTVWNCLYGSKPLIAGQTVLALGTGGVSVFTLQFAKAAGARVICTSSSDEKLARVRALGADDVINYRKEEDWHGPVRELTAGRGVDHVVEVGGAGTLQRSIFATRVGGTVSLVGVLTDGGIMPVTILAGGVNVRGVLVGSRQMFEDMNRMITQAKLRPVIDRVFPLQDAKAAYKHLESQAHLGKVVIDLGGGA